MKKGLAKKKKRERFKLAHPEGRKAFARAKKEAKKNEQRI
ncbi:hypothetical protein LCGC14_2121040 [marine sediment metagenome]|uniref:Uncharacterized protein n=1 Tax=marine sediment metagenome TaxID=412755 RepID=A0A0F9H0K2_9ZZZZ